MAWCNKFGIHYLFNDVSVSLLSILIPCIIIYEHSCLHCMWLRCIKSCIEDLIHGFLVNRWLVHDRFMDLGNPLVVVMHYLLIEGMTSLSYRDGFPMVSVLVCMVTYRTRLVVSHDLRLSSNHDLTKMLHCVISQPWEKIEFVLKLPMTLTYEWDCKLIIYSLWIGSLLMEIDSNMYSQ